MAPSLSGPKAVPLQTTYAGGMAISMAGKGDK